jgi:hypothetical protein
MVRIYLTHCSGKKEERYQTTGEAVSPDLLYTSARTQRFIRSCRARGVRWAIFSDLYGVWFPEARHGWCEKDPNKVTEAEFSALLRDFDEKLTGYSEIFFYRHPGRFHRLYVRLLKTSVLADRVKLIKHVKEIS